MSPGPDSVIVRRAGHADLERVWPLARDFATSYRPTHAAFGRTFTALLEAPSTVLLVADDGTEVVGYLLGHVHPTFLADGPVGWVEELMVAETARRRGAGRALMHAAETWAAARGAAYLSLASRRAGPFYRALGYDESATFFKLPLPRTDGPTCVSTSAFSHPRP